jgi:hypothetical protein
MTLLKSGLTLRKGIGDVEINDVSLANKLFEQSTHNTV